MKNPIRKTYDWTLSLAKKKTASIWLGIISFTEASFFPIPPDILLIPLCLGAVVEGYIFRNNLLNRICHGWSCRVWHWIFYWDGLQEYFYQFVPGFTEEKFSKIAVWYEEWGRP